MSEEEIKNANVPGLADQKDQRIDERTEAETTRKETIEAVETYGLVVGNYTDDELKRYLFGHDENDWKKHKVTTRHKHLFTAESKAGKEDPIAVEGGLFDYKIFGRNKKCSCHYGTKRLKDGEDHIHCDVCDVDVVGNENVDQIGYWLRKCGWYETCYPILSVTNGAQLLVIIKSLNPEFLGLKRNPSSSQLRYEDVKELCQTAFDVEPLQPEEEVADTEHEQRRIESENATNRKKSDGNAATNPKVKIVAGPNEGMMGTLIVKKVNINENTAGSIRDQNIGLDGLYRMFCAPGHMYEIEGVNLDEYMHKVVPIMPTILRQPQYLEMYSTYQYDDMTSGYTALIYTDELLRKYYFSTESTTRPNHDFVALCTYMCLAGFALQETYSVLKSGKENSFRLAMTGRVRKSARGHIIAADVAVDTLLLPVSMCYEMCRGDIIKQLSKELYHGRNSAAIVIPWIQGATKLVRVPGRSENQMLKNASKEIIGTKPGIANETLTRLSKKEILDILPDDEVARRTSSNGGETPVEQASFAEKEVSENDAEAVAVERNADTPMESPESIIDRNEVGVKLPSKVKYRDEKGNFFTASIKDLERVYKIAGDKSGTPSYILVFEPSKENLYDDAGRFSMTAEEAYLAKHPKALEILYEILDRSVVLFNRQPTLSPYSMYAFKVQVWEDLEGGGRRLYSNFRNVDGEHDKWDPANDQRKFFDSGLGDEADGDSPNSRVVKSLYRKGDVEGFEPRVNEILKRRIDANGNRGLEGTGYYKYLFKPDEKAAAIGMNPVICEPFNADFDGDTMCVYLITDPYDVRPKDPRNNKDRIDGRKVIGTAENLLDSAGVKRNWFYAKDFEPVFKVMGTPAMGLYIATHAKYVDRKAEKASKLNAATTHLTRFISGVSHTKETVAVDGSAPPCRFLNSESGSVDKVDLQMLSNYIADSMMEFSIKEYSDSDSDAYFEFKESSDASSSDKGSAGNSPKIERKLIHKLTNDDLQVIEKGVISEFTGSKGLFKNNIATSDLGAEFKNWIRSFAVKVHSEISGATKFGYGKKVFQPYVLAYKELLSEFRGKDLTGIVEGKFNDDNVNVSEEFEDLLGPTVSVKKIKELLLIMSKFVGDSTTTYDAIAIMQGRKPVDKSGDKLDESSRKVVMDLFGAPASMSIDQEDTLLKFVEKAVSLLTTDIIDGNSIISPNGNVKGYSTFKLMAADRDNGELEDFEICSLDGWKTCYGIERVNNIIEQYDISNSEGIKAKVNSMVSDNLKSYYLAFDPVYENDVVKVAGAPADSGEQAPEARMFSEASESGVRTRLNVDEFISGVLAIPYDERDQAKRIEIIKQALLMNLDGEIQSDKYGTAEKKIKEFCEDLDSVVFMKPEGDFLPDFEKIAQEGRGQDQHIISSILGVNPKKGHNYLGCKLHMKNLSKLSAFVASSRFSMLNRAQIVNELSLYGEEVAMKYGTSVVKFDEMLGMTPNIKAILEKMTERVNGGLLDGRIRREDILSNLDEIVKKYIEELAPTMFEQGIVDDPMAKIKLQSMLESIVPLIATETDENGNSKLVINESNLMIGKSEENFFRSVIVNRSVLNQKGQLVPESGYLSYVVGSTLNSYKFLDEKSTDQIGIPVRKSDAVGRTKIASVEGHREMTYLNEKDGKFEKYEFVQSCVQRNFDEGSFVKIGELNPYIHRIDSTNYNLGGYLSSAISEQTTQAALALKHVGSLWSVAKENRYHLGDKCKIRVLNYQKSDKDGIENVFDEECRLDVEFSGMDIVNDGVAGEHLEGVTRRTFFPFHPGNPMNRDVCMKEKNAENEADRYVYDEKGELVFFSLEQSYVDATLVKMCEVLGHRLTKKTTTIIPTVNRAWKDGYVVYSTGKMGIVEDLGDDFDASNYVHDRLILGSSVPLREDLVYYVPNGTRVKLGQRLNSGILSVKEMFDLIVSSGRPEDIKITGWVVFYEEVKSMFNKLQVLPIEALFREFFLAYISDDFNREKSKSVMMSDAYESKSITSITRGGAIRKIGELENVSPDEYLSMLIRRATKMAPIVDMLNGVPLQGKRDPQQGGGSKASIMNLQVNNPSES